jgi:hypothetical protein
MSIYTPGLTWSLHQAYWGDYTGNNNGRPPITLPMPVSPIDVTGGTQTWQDIVYNNTTYDACRYNNIGWSVDLTSMETGTQSSVISNNGNTHHFTLRYVGYIYTQSQNGTWRFVWGSDDESMLWLGPIVYGNGYSRNTCFGNNTYFYLPPYTYVPIFLMYGERDGGYSVNMYAIRPDGGTFYNGNGWYYSRTNYTAILSQYAINFSNCIIYFPFNNDTLNYANNIGTSGGSIQGSYCQLSTTTYKIGTTSLQSGNANSSSSYFAVCLIPPNQNGYTFVCWLYITSTTAGMVFSFSQYANNNARIYLFYSSSNLYISVGNNFQCYTPPLNTWFHFAWTLDKSSNSTVYINGSSVATTTIVTYVSFYCDKNAIFADPYSGGTGFTVGAYGYMNAFAYFDAVLPAASIATIYTIGTTNLVITDPTTVITNKLLWIDANNPGNSYTLQGAGNYKITQLIDASQTGNLNAMSFVGGSFSNPAPFRTLIPEQSAQRYACFLFPKWWFYWYVQYCVYRDNILLFYSI